VRHHLLCNQAGLCQPVCCHAFLDARLGHYRCRQRYHSAGIGITSGVTQTGWGTKAMSIVKLAIVDSRVGIAESGCATLSSAEPGFASQMEWPSRGCSAV